MPVIVVTVHYVRKIIRKHNNITCVKYVIFNNKSRLILILNCLHHSTSRSASCVSTSETVYSVPRPDFRINGIRLCII